MFFLPSVLVVLPSLDLLFIGVTVKSIMGLPCFVAEARLLIKVASYKAQIMGELFALNLLVVDRLFLMALVALALAGRSARRRPAAPRPPLRLCTPRW